MFPELRRLALVVGSRIGHLYADAGYDSADPYLVPTTAFIH